MVSSAQPIFVLCTARSGSTLLRIILDAHPDVACPPELNLAPVFAAISYAASSACSNDTEAARTTGELCEHVLAQTLGAYAARTGKKQWCEKSLPSADHAELLLHLFPQARFVCLYRECTDTIVSLLEACPWGYSAYGLEPYVRAQPTNFAAALAAYWADRTEAIQVFESTHSDVCQRIRYEDLVFSPRGTLHHLCRALDLEWHERLSDPQFALASRPRTAAGDYKLRYTTSFDTDSVGRGWTVPVEAIVEPLRSRIDALSAELGYPRLGSDVRESLASRRRVAAAVSRSSAKRDNGVIEHMLARLAHGSGGGTDGSFGGTVKLVLAGEREPWFLDFSSRSAQRREAAAACTVLTDRATLREIADGTLNPGVALRQSRIRIGSDVLSTPDSFLEHLDALFALLAPERVEREPHSELRSRKEVFTHDSDQGYVRA